MKIYFILLVIIMQGCASAFVGNHGSSVTKLSDGEYILRLQAGGRVPQDAVDQQAAYHADSLCLGQDYEASIIDIQTESNTIMVEGAFVEINTDKIKALIKCGGENESKIIHIAQGEYRELPSGYSKIRIFNSSNGLLYAGNTGYIYVEIDDLIVSKLPVKQYIDLYIENGVKQVNLFHIDLVKMETSIELNIKDQETFLKVWASPFSTKSEIVDVLPKNFDSAYTSYLSVEEK